MDESESAKIEKDAIVSGTNAPAGSTSPKNTLSAALKSRAKISKTNEDDTLINVHIGNPLRRITEILEDIKKQKAFSFTLKGSLGIMGVVLTLSLLGFFGTTHALCDKGIQTHIGRVKVLQVTDPEPDNLLAKMQRALEYYKKFLSAPVQNAPRYRYILEKPDHKTIHLSRGRDVTLSIFKNEAVYATGAYDSCSQQMTLETAESIETYH